MVSNWTTSSLSNQRIVLVQILLISPIDASHRVSVTEFLSETFPYGLHHKVDTSTCSPRSITRRPSFGLLRPSLRLGDGDMDPKSRPRSGRPNDFLPPHPSPRILHTSNYFLNISVPVVFRVGKRFRAGTGFAFYDGRMNIRQRVKPEIEGGHR
jgi:hypothetical protein